jgi:RNA polymerase sigma-70 factor (ECF subfamily)
MPEIALALGIAVATGWKRLNEARRTLAAALQRSPRPTGVMPVPLTLDGLFAAERNGPDGLAESVVERVRSRVRDALRAAPLLGTSGSAVGETARLAARAVRNAFVRGAIVGAVVGGATAGGATAAYLRHGGVADPPPVPVASIAAPALPAGLVASAAPPEPGPTAVTSSSTAVPAAPPSSAAPRAAVSDLNDDEASLIRTARMAYAHGETTHALDALNRHARKYPRGQLAADREALRAQVLAAAAAASSAPAPSATSPPRVRFGIDE